MATPKVVGAVGRAAAAYVDKNKEGKRLIHRQTHGSSAIDRIGYNPLTQEVHILFNKGGKYPEYIYGGVPRDIATAFMTARSPGTFFHRYINKKKAYRVKRAFGSFRLGAIGRRVRNVFRIGRP